MAILSLLSLLSLLSACTRESGRAPVSTTESPATESPATESPATGARALPGQSGPQADGSLESGLLARHDDGTHTVFEVTPTPNFYLRESASVHPALAPRFRSVLSGSLSVLEGGRYTFELAAGTLTLDGAEVGRAPVELGAGPHSLRLDFERPPGPARLQVRWASERFTREPVPARLLSHPAPDPLQKEALEDEADVERGRWLAEEYGCVACHEPPPGTAGLEPRRGPDLTRIGSRTNAAWIHAWLAQPKKFRGGAVMPVLLDAPERATVALYLSELGKNRPGNAKPFKIRESYVEEGRALYETIGCKPCHDEDGLELEGLGSKHSQGTLAAYLRDPTAIDPSGRMPSLLLSGEEARRLASFLVQSKNASFEAPVPSVPDGARARGRKLVQTSGCLACHTLTDGEPLENLRQAKPLDALKPTQGCLANEPPRGLPAYTFGTGEREALQAFLRATRVRPDLHPAPLHTLRRRLQQLRCTNCHTVAGAPPPRPLAERIPSLTLAGDKLKPSWIERVLVDGVRARPFLRTRMPHFSPTAIRPLIPALAALAGHASGTEPTTPEDSDPLEKLSSEELDAHRSRGIVLLGTNSQEGGLSCISCHDFGPHAPVADEKGPQLLNVFERLRFDWFRRWMLAPARLVSGTSMPAFFGDSPGPEAEDAILQLWAAFSLKDRLPMPDGVGTTAISANLELLPVATNEAIVLRFLLPEATAAAIAVGLPRKPGKPSFSYCFDAGQGYFLYAWQGGFLDLTESTGKRQNHPKLLGEVFYRQRTTPWRTGQATEAAQDHRFRGYRIVDGVPEFSYEVDGAAIRERIRTTAEGDGITREFSVEDATQGLWFEPAPAPGVRIESTLGGVSDATPLQLPRETDVQFGVTFRRVEEKGGTPR